MEQMKEDLGTQTASLQTAKSMHRLVYITNNLSCLPPNMMDLEFWKRPIIKYERDAVLNVVCGVIKKKGRLFANTSNNEN